MIPILFRFYSACDQLVFEFGIDGKLMYLPREKMCRIADPKACTIIFVLL